METHPVPQNITSYEFRLVGDMTLKQFLQLAGGTVLAILAYNMPVPGIIKYPLVFIFALVGVLLAFVPINNRPFSQWLWAFFKAIYSPTEYVWTPTAKITVDSAPVTQVKSASPPKSSIFSSFHRPAKIPSATPPPTVNASSPSTLTVDSISSPPPPEPVVERIVSVESQTTTSKLSQLHPLSFSDENKAEPKEEPVADTPPRTVFTATPVDDQRLAAKDHQPTTTKPLETLNTPPILPKSAPLPSGVTAATPSAQSVAAPTTPNVLAGLVSAPGDKLLEGVTVEIIDSSTGIPARALRTNRIGQFQIAIPLANGTYVVNAEKDGFLFDPVSIQAGGTIIPPIILAAKPA